MKRLTIAAVAVVALLVGAGAAYAAVNNYSASYTFHGKKTGALSFQQKITVTPATSGNRTGILHDIKTTISGVKVDASGFPTCTAAKINAASTDTGCPKKSLVATGSIKATLGSATDFTSAGQACDPALHVYNGGPGKLVFFFVENAAHQCLGGQLHTGQVPPYPGTYHTSGGKLTVNIPIPNTVDYPLGQSGGEVGSLSSENLKWISQSMGSKHDINSTGCSGSKRNYTYTFNASIPGQATETKSTKGSASCA